MKHLKAAWLPRVHMEGVNLHWTGGGYFPNPTDLRAYHLLIDGEGGVHRGIPGIELNSGSLKPGYSAHTLNGNTNRIGLSLCGMGGAVEAPFNPGRFPLKPIQLRTAAEVARELAEFYSFPVTRRTVLTHAEVQPTLGIAQRQKWDWTRLPYDVTTIRGAIPIGDWFRGMVTGAKFEAAPAPVPAGATGRVTASSLIARRSPNGEAAGSVPRGTILKIEDERDGWLWAETPAGHVFWFSAAHVEIIDGPRPEAPTTPDPRRVIIAEMRALADKLEALL